MVPRQDCRGNAPRRLGVAVRQWPGLEPETVADRVIQAAGESEARSIAFYVLEAPAGRGPDLRFTHSVVSRLRSCAAFRSADIAVRPYVSSELVDFVQDMASCLVAISMKLHSSAIWSATDTPLYPISYAPKTAAFFGVPFKGLEVFDRVVPPVEDEPSIPPARDVVASWRSEVLAHPFDSGRVTLGRWTKLQMQCRSTSRDLGVAIVPNG